MSRGHRAESDKDNSWECKTILTGSKAGLRRTDNIHFDAEKCSLAFMHKKARQHKHRMGENRLGSRTSGEDLGTLADLQLNTSHQSDVAAKNANGILSLHEEKPRCLDHEKS